MSYRMVKELRKLFTDLADRRDPRVVVIHGAGKHFCSGMDLTADFSSMTDSGFDLGKGTSAAAFEPRGYKIQEDYSDVVLRMRQVPQPLIAVLHGRAVHTISHYCWNRQQ